MTPRRRIFTLYSNLYSRSYKRPSVQRGADCMPHGVRYRTVGCAVAPGCLAAYRTDRNRFRQREALMREEDPDGSTTLR